MIGDRGVFLVGISIGTVRIAKMRMSDRRVDGKVCIVAEVRELAIVGAVPFFFFRGY